MILYGKPVAESVLEVVRERVSSLEREGRACTIASVRVGENPDDAAYERSISRACEKSGIGFNPAVLPADASTEDVLREIALVNTDAAISGCIVFQPMPAHIDSQKVRDALSPEKDIDCISDAALGEVLLGNAHAFSPATAEAVIQAFDYYGIELEGKSVAVVGRSRVIGKPVGLLALERHATVTFCHSRTAKLHEVTKGADIVICAVGRPRLFTRDYFREGQCIMDIGMNVDDSGSLCGDVAFDEVEPIAGAITPVPGGIGAITTSILLEHATREACATVNESE